MAEKSAISWTRSTMNPWIGCTKVGPGCDHCYAEVSTPARSMAIKWGAGQPRYRTKPANWNKPLKWDRLAAEEKRTGVITPGHESWGRPGFWPVFCASLADVFDNGVEQAWREDLWNLIEATPNLSWLLVTKRIGNVPAMLPVRWVLGIPANVRILITVVNQAEADRDVPKLLALNCKNGISYEPALGPVDWTHLRPEGLTWLDALAGRAHEHPAVYDTGRRIDWIIVGGESSQGGALARPFDIEWARNTVTDCKAAGVPVFVKQLGSLIVGQNFQLTPNDVPPAAVVSKVGTDGIARHIGYALVDRAGADPDEWPKDLRVQEFPL